MNDGGMTQQIRERVERGIREFEDAQLAPSPADLERPLVVVVDPPHDVEELHRRYQDETALHVDALLEGEAKLVAEPGGTRIALKPNLSGDRLNASVRLAVNRRLSADGYGPRRRSS